MGKEGVGDASRHGVGGKVGRKKDKAHEAVRSIWWERGKDGGLLPGEGKCGSRVVRRESEGEGTFVAGGFLNWVLAWIVVFVVRKERY